MTLLFSDEAENQLQTAYSSLVGRDAYDRLASALARLDGVDRDLYVETEASAYFGDDGDVLFWFVVLEATPPGPSRMSITFTIDDETDATVHTIDWK